MRKPDDIKQPSRLTHTETKRANLMKESEPMEALKPHLSRPLEAKKDLLQEALGQISKRKATKTTWYVVTIKLKGKAESKEVAKENCRLRLVHMASLPEKYIEIVEVSECSPP